MTIETLDADVRVAAAPEGARRRFSLLAKIAAGYIYLLVLLGGTVRITGSGLGCGDHWPKCNGSWIPPFDLPTLIEYAHRMVAASVLIPIGLVVLVAWRNRHAAGFSGPGGLLRPIGAMLGLLLVQVTLGAVTVKLDLPAGVTATHFVIAMLILAALVVAALRASVPEMRATGAVARFGPMATAAALLGLVVVAFGALTANLGLIGASTQPSAAAWACQGFPLCNGQLVPAGGATVHTHWTHRLLAFTLALHVLGAVVAAYRRGAPAPVRRAAAASLLLVLAQIGVAAGMVLMQLHNHWRGLHLAVGTALWVALVAWAVRARQADRVIGVTTGRFL